MEKCLTLKQNIFNISKIEWMDSSGPAVGVLSSLNIKESKGETG